MPFKMCFLFLLILTVSSVASGVKVKNSALSLSEALALPRVTLTSIDFAGLIELDKSTVLASVTALTTIGALQINGIPNFKQLREDALSSLHVCLNSETSSEVIMNDGARRRTIAIGSHHGVADVWDERLCGGNDKSKLRSAVDVATRQLFHALDLTKKSSSSSSSSYIMKPYESFLNIFDKGEHLEHFHTYYPSLNRSDSPTMDFHTDSGLLIAMTAGYYQEEPNLSSAIKRHLSSDNNNNNDNNNVNNNLRDLRGLYIELPTGDRAKVSTTEDSLIIMVGRGSAQWMDSKALLGESLRAIPHAMISGLDGLDGLVSASRSWYGKMYQPPHDAIIINSSGGGSDKPMTYSVLRSLEINRFIASKSTINIKDKQISNIPAACSENYDTSLAIDGKSSAGQQYNYDTSTKLTSNDLCVTSTGKVGLYCWMQCESVESLSCGHEAFCYDTVALEVVSGDITCPSGAKNCELQCVSPPTTADAANFDGYCYGRGASMIMAGFTSISYEFSGSTPCLNLLFSNWTLDSKVKYFFACIGVFIMGVAIQFISKYRSDRAKDTSKSSIQSNVVMTLLFGLQLTLSYFAMLVAMTYSVELFVMVIVGLTVGFGIFNIKRPFGAETVEPCCDYSQHGSYKEIDQDLQEISLVDRSKFDKIED